MKKILVTGANGFIGRNVCAELGRLKDDYILFKADIDTDETTLDNYIGDCDFVVHLAGVNRPKNDGEFFSGNGGLTQQILKRLEEHKNTVPVAMTSSIQAELDNSYGKSKLEAERAVLAYSKKNGAAGYVFRLPNVFGKWCRQNYNSAVATFCYNIAHDIPIEVNAPERVMTLVYIDDVVELIKKAIGGGLSVREDGYCDVPVTHDIKLAEIASKLLKFHDSRKTLIMPSLRDELDKELYSTYLSYLDTDAFSYPLEKKEDSRGWLYEFIKSRDMGQFFVSKTKPGVTRGNHWHHTKVEKFLVISGEATIKFRKIDGGNIIEYKVSGENPTPVDIPVGYTHSIKNTSDTKELITLFWANEMFNPDKPDTYFLEV
ncbi:MAG: NAD-dependent epimerase/dehydratase family protein [Oscillospiraceae bacterium]